MMVHSLGSRFCSLACLASWRENIVRSGSKLDARSAPNGLRGSRCDRAAFCAFQRLEPRRTRSGVFNPIKAFPRESLRFRGPQGRRQPVASRARHSEIKNNHPLRALRVLRGSSFFGNRSLGAVALIPRKTLRSASRASLRGPHGRAPYGCGPSQQPCKRARTTVTRSSIPTPRSPSESHGGT